MKLRPKSIFYNRDRAKVSTTISHEIRACGKLALFLWKTLCKIGVDIVVFIVYNRGINIKRKVMMKPSEILDDTKRIIEDTKRIEEIRKNFEKGL